MKTTLIVDGYNAIYAIPEARKKLKDNLLSARSKVIMLTKEYVRSSGYITDFCVVFDGQSKYRAFDRMHARHGGKHVFSETDEGDDRIIEAIKKYAEQGRVVAASKDNYVRNNARSHGASLINSEELAGKKAKGERQEAKEEGKQIDRKTRDQITKEYMEELGLE